MTIASFIWFVSLIYVVEHHSNGNAQTRTHILRILHRYGEILQSRASCFRRYRRFYWLCFIPLFGWSCLQSSAWSFLEVKFGTKSLWILFKLITIGVLRTTRKFVGYDDQYNFNTMTSSLISLYVASQKPFIFSNIFYELCGSDSYVYFVLYWLFVPIANLLVLKAVLFQRYWTEMKLLEDLTLWYKEKERIYLKNQKRKKKHHHHSSSSYWCEAKSSHVAQFVDRVSRLVVWFTMSFFLRGRFSFFFIFLSET